ncbi:MAG: lysylphosphatidylglycerol synthase domain-containing protein [Janthinobacterium lividum]
MRWGQLAALIAGTAALTWMLSAVGWNGIVHAAVLGGPALPAALLIHAGQLLLAGLAWRAAIGVPALSRLFVARVRWIREGVNTMLPAAHIGGQVIGVRLLVNAGATPVRAVVGTILDLTLEALAQLVVVVAAVGLLLVLQDGERAWLFWAGAGLGGLGLTVGLILIALRLGALRAIEAGLQRVASRWPGARGWSMSGLHAMLVERQADRGAMLRSMLFSVASWSLGTLEVWVILRALGADPRLEVCFVIESLAMAARSAGFAIPGAVGVQEGGFVLACGLFGIGAETALALSVLKRLRELIVGGGALLAWQFAR